MSNIRVLIVSEHASLKFGGEAALPLHYFRVLRKRGIEAWLLVHERTRGELEALFPEDSDRLLFVPDTFWHLWLNKYGSYVPAKVSYFTFGYGIRLLTQLLQRRMVKRAIQEQQINIVHQPIPVSPKEPSLLFGFGIPVIIGPMNGGMTYPPAFKKSQNPLIESFVGLGRLSSDWLNTLMPGKKKASTLLVANARTRNALPKGVQGQVIEMVENGVDLELWHPQPHTTTEIKFVFVGRLVDWKAVDLLLLAFKQVVEQIPATLEIIGEGKERANLEAQVQALGLTPSVRFIGWLSQADCAEKLAQATALVLPSLYECGGAVVLEAMAMSVPVVATNWGGPADYIDRSCGILVEPTSREALIEQLAVAMIEIARSPELRSHLGKAGYLRVCDRFNWEIKVDQMLEIYDEALRNGEPSHSNFNRQNSKTPSS